MKYVNDRPYADPEAAARKIMEIARGHAPYMDGWLLVERLNGPMLFEFKATPAEWKAGIDYAIEHGWLWRHESGTYYKFTDKGRDLI